MPPFGNLLRTIEKVLGFTPARVAAGELGKAVGAARVVVVAAAVAAAGSAARR
jgi:hypothetical protein